MANYRIFAAVLALALAAPAPARQIDLPVAASKAQFEAVRQKLTDQLGTDEYVEITPDDKWTVLAALERIQKRYDKLANPDQMGEQDRVDTFNDQEIINTIITHAAADSRLICDRDSATGTHRIRVTCMTLATLRERGRAGEESRRELGRSRNNTFPGATTMRPGITK